MTESGPATEWNEAEFHSVLVRLEAEGTVDARRVRISPQQLERILEAAPRDPDRGDRPMLRGANFHGATFTGGASFDGATFTGDAWFGGATFTGDAWFGGATFTGASFDGTTFTGDARFGGATFTGGASFDGTTFTGDASFGRATFTGDARFGRATFTGDAWFDGATFTGGAWFDGATFTGDAWFGRATFTGDAWFGRATFRSRVWLGPVVAAGTLSFDQAAFDEEVRLDAAAAQLSCRGTRFGGRADLNVRWAEVALDEATFVQRSRLAGVEPFPYIDDSLAQVCRVDRRLDAQPRPRVLSVRQANVENLALGNIDLRACRFYGAHGLDQLRVEADCDFAEPPPRRRYTRRRTLAEEHHWRARRSLEGAVPPADPEAAPASNPSGRQDSGDWNPPECQPAAWLEQGAEGQTLDAPRIASLYRLLRKALEDRKDEPGAANFYYGEMEMRRHSRPAGRRPEGRATRDRGEHAILTLYWLLSGYGLRATRAFGALLVTLTLFTALLYVFGLRPDHRHFSDALLQSIEGAAFRATDRSVLNQVGQYLQVALRILGPLFLGLALLSLRGRVKR